MISKRRSVFGKIVIFLISFICAASTSVMLLCGKINLDCFYDVGEVYEELCNYLWINGQGWQCDGSGQVRITSSSASYVVALRHKEFPWRYIKVTLDQLNVPEVRWRLTFMDHNGNAVGERSCSLKEGVNLVQIETGKFRSIQIEMEGQNGSSFLFKKFMLYENAPVFQTKTFILYFFICFLIYLIGISLLGELVYKWKKQKNLYALVDILQSGYLYLAEKLMKKFPGLAGLTSRMRNRVRTGMFFFMFLLMTITEGTLNYKGVGYRYLLLICSLILFVIAVISLEGEVKKRNWNNPIVGCWVILWLIACISDLIVYKSFHYTGYMMLTIMGFLFFVWGNMEQPGALVKNMQKAVAYSFLPAYGYCVIFGPVVQGPRYAGIHINPIPFAIYLVLVLIAYFAEMIERINEKWNWKDLYCIVAALLAIHFAWKTQSTFPLGTIVLVILFFISWGIRLTLQTGKRKLWGYIALAAVLFFPSGYVLDWQLQDGGQLQTSYLEERQIFRAEHLREMQGIHLIQSTNDTPGTVTAQAAQAGGENRVIEKILSPNLERFTSGRTVFYKYYLRAMNLWGHAKSAKFWEDRHQAHNAVLMIAYRYGVFAAVPYILLMALFLKNAIAVLKKQPRLSEWWFLCAISGAVGLMLLYDNLEQPFRWISWPLYFIGMGAFFENKVEKQTTELQQTHEV